MAITTTKLVIAVTQTLWRALYAVHLHSTMYLHGYSKARCHRHRDCNLINVTFRHILSVCRLLLYLLIYCPPPPLLHLWSTNYLLFTFANNLIHIREYTRSVLCTYFCLWLSATGGEIVVCNLVANALKPQREMFSERWGMTQWNVNLNKYTYNFSKTKIN